MDVKPLRRGNSARRENAVLGPGSKEKIKLPAGDGPHSISVLGNIEQQVAHFKQLRNSTAWTAEGEGDSVTGLFPRDGLKHAWAKRPVPSALPKDIRSSSTGGKKKS